MTFVQIHKKPAVADTPALFNLGFRPFFLGAAIFACVSIAVWSALYFGRLQLPLGRLSTYQWHSHEMIYGYALAVVAGFLLTAVSNWTGIKTVHGILLAGLWGAWIAARAAFLCGVTLLPLAAAADLIFCLGLLIAVAIPIVKSKQWKQAGILSKLVLFTAGNAYFYLGGFGVCADGARVAVYGGLYLIVALMLTIGSRVMPAFIQNGVDSPVEIPNTSRIAALSMVLFLPFFVNELFVENVSARIALSLALFTLNGLRLMRWHTPGIWRKPLLWSLFLAFVCVDAGFLLLAASALGGVSPYLAVHAFAFGGIGLATLSMMSRVTLGHTGRSIRVPPKIISYAAAVLAGGALIRVVVPLVAPGAYGDWILLAQLSWIAAFSLFLVAHARMLLRARVDGRPE